MLKKTVKSILALYNHQNLEIQKKSKLLLTIIAAVMIIDVSLLPLFLTKTITIYVVFGLLAAFCIFASSIYFLKKGKFDYTVNILIYTVFILLILNMVNLEIRNPHMVYSHSMLFLFVVILSFMFSMKSNAIILHAALCVITMVIFHLIINFKTVTTEPKYFPNFIISIMTFIVFTFFMVKVHTIQKAILRIAEHESEKNRTKAQEIEKLVNNLTAIITQAKETSVRLYSSTKEIEAASQLQTSAAKEHAAEITKVSATLEELTITANQITRHVDELTAASEEIAELLEESKQDLSLIVAELDEAGAISTQNNTEIGELGKRSVIINEMVEIIKNIANKTNILSINASIEAVRSNVQGDGFSVIAAEIRELSKETMVSAKSVEQAAKEIQNFLSSIIKASECESGKVLAGGITSKKIADKIHEIVAKIKNNHSFTRKINFSVKQQERGSQQVAHAIKEMSAIARQSSETARQTLLAVKEIVGISEELEASTLKNNTDN